MKHQRKAFSVVSLDIAKAFDTVPHGVISSAVHSRNLDETTTRYINTSLSSTITMIKVGSKQTNQINIKKEVKQGDPLSPLLFNLALDELLTHINTKEQTASIDNATKLSAMAFADDLVLMADDPLEMPMLKNKVVRHLQ